MSVTRSTMYIILPTIPHPLFAIALQVSTQSFDVRLFVFRPDRRAAAQTVMVDRSTDPANEEDSWTIVHDKEKWKQLLDFLLRILLFA
jgi:hypothetical protein